jgi:hypothetical protein
MKTIVFVGPTLPEAQVRAILPTAIVAPPIAVGDLVRALARRAPARFAIIDGYFEHMAAVWHKEILLALERGCAVYGAASMGALRAAELARFGMVGIGAIYRAYARGTLVADDEVAVAHLPAEHGFRAVSDALVNLRAGLARAPMLDRAARARLLAIAQRTFYRERSWTRLIDDARREGVPARTLAALAAWPKPDAKAADARALLRTLARTPSRRRRAASGSVPRTWAFRQLLLQISQDPV